MSGKKGMCHYPDSFKDQIRQEHKKIQSFEQAQQLIDNYIQFYNLECFQLKYRLTPFQKRSQTV